EDSMSWFIKCFKDAFHYSGRARRAEFWTYFWLTVIFCLLYFSLKYWLFPSAPTVFSYIPAIVFFFPGLAVLIRRLHDTNRSGWLGGWFYVFYFLFPLLAAYGVVFSLVANVYGLYLLALVLTAGDIGPNRYGEDPIGNPDRKPGKSFGVIFAILLAVIVLLFVLLLALLPLLSAKSRPKAKQTYCVNNLKQIGLCVILYADDNDDCLPADIPACVRECFGKEASEKVLHCQRDETAEYYDFAVIPEGLKMSDVESPATFPLVTCHNHKVHKPITVYLDGHVEVE
ncbi:MAG: DUF805 domain-containing protein, partial [Lentisphaeria bacterium]|nr:DUF805 domain-containing protein [Lentisphaeria bacterium]